MDMLPFRLAIVHGISQAYQKMDKFADCSVTFALHGTQEPAEILLREAARHRNC